MKKTVGGTTTFYLVDDRNPSGYAQVVEEYEASTLTAVYTHGLDLISQRRSGTVSYYIYDGHGSVRALTGTSGTVTDTYQYDAYGTKLSTSSGSTANNYLYTGEQFDSDLGFYYLRARYYKPDTGRFWTMDTFEGNQEDSLSLHKYLYAQANPLNLVDPSGHDGNFISLMASIKTMTVLAVNVGMRAYPAVYRVTVIVFEATTGNTVMVGGAGAVVALKAGGKMGGVGWSTWQRIGNFLKGRKIGTYDELAAGLRGNGVGEAANHLNQAAAFSRIPHGEGVSVAMGGPTSRVGTSHNAFHHVLEDFWNLFRTGPRRFTRPTNAEYDEVLQRALEQAGHAADDASELVKLAREARKSYGYFDGPGGLPPEVPGRMPLP